MAILHLRIDPASGVPIYLQIIEQVKYTIARGVLKAHDELPSVRALASQYLINPNTVARAYLELARDGVIYKKRGMGTYVAEKDVTMSQREKVEIVRQLLDKAWVQARELGLSSEEMQQVFNDTLENFSEDD
ncbi:MAG: GntR family transcriptional regulator [Candidatus Latescibacteria bacterium]|nr:GntR family transcriptional regulator [Candidatus Latescibacterota bacterium]